MPRAAVNGINTYYEISGEGAPLLLVHGLGTGALDWASQVPALSTRYRVIVPSLRGFGQSEKPAGPYSMTLFAEDLRALLDHLGVKRCHVCGISMGGAIAFQFAIDFPDRILSLTAISSQPSFELNSLKKRILMGSRVLLARLIGLEREGAIMRRFNFPGAHNRELRKRLAGRFDTQLAPYLAGIDALAGWTVVDRLQDITVPVMFLTGEFDYTPPEEKAMYAEKISDARVVVIDGARHAMHLEFPERINAALLSFLREVDTAGVEPSADRA